MHGKSETFLFTDATNIGSLKSIGLKWKYLHNPLNPGTLCVMFCNKNLYVSSVAVVAMNDYNAPNARYDMSCVPLTMINGCDFIVVCLTERTKFSQRVACSPLLLT